jgi:diguanylate cyclase (GGDEF)-like protein
MSSVFKSLPVQARLELEKGKAHRLLASLSIMQACRDKFTFCQTTLEQISDLYPDIQFSAFLDASSNHVSFEVIARYGPAKAKLDPVQYQLLKDALQAKTTLCIDGSAALALVRGPLILGAVFLSSKTPWQEDDKNLLDQFAVNAARGFETTTVLEEAENLAFKDGLTSLENRASFKKSVATAVNLVQKSSDETLVIAQFVLEDLPELNIALGYAIGDELLRQTADQLKQKFPNAISIARTSGDGFAICVPLKNGEDTRKIPKSINEIFDIILPDQMQLPHLTPRIGLSEFPADGDNSDRLWKNTNTALANTKMNGGRNYCFYDSEIEIQIHGRVTLNKALREGVQKQELSLNYQPQICLKSGNMIGVEALLRWQRDGGDFVPADTFIPIAEASGLLGPISEWVLQKACEQRMRWTVEGVPEFPVAVNISLNEFQSDDFVPLVKNILAKSGLPPHLLHIELTESVIMEDRGQTQRNLQLLTEMGIKLCIDDFGTGYSSLSYLSHLPASVLKIDKSFIDGVGVNDSDAAIAMTIISLGYNLGMHVLAEGVETQEQIQFLKKAGCHQAQGFAFSRPVTSDKIPNLAAVTDHLVPVA